MCHVLIRRLSYDILKSSAHKGRCFHLNGFGNPRTSGLMPSQFYQPCVALRQNKGFRRLFATLRFASP
jgi:hypothetical protein